jgi:hypothetical protein
MREVKFRAWSRQNHHWVEPSLLAITCNGRLFFQDSGEDLVSRADLVLLQCSDLKDKHGKDIYEGDIVTDGRDRMAVRFGNGAFIFDHSSTDEYNGKNVSPLNLVNEVIGNIYENPDLILRAAGTE